MIDLDPAILDQESIRKKRRKKMLLIALAPIIILVLASLLFLRPGAFNILFSSAYKQSDASDAISISQFHKNINIIEQYIAPFDAGTAYLKDSDGEKAEAEFRESLQKDPPEYAICQIRVNLSYSIELQADKAKNTGNYEDSLILYNKAEGVLYEDNCASKQEKSESKDEKAEEAKRRISEKRSAAVSSLNSGSGGSGESGEYIDDTELSEDKVQELKKELIDGNTIRNGMQQKRLQLQYSDVRHW